MRDVLQVTSSGSCVLNVTVYIVRDAYTSRHLELPLGMFARCTHKKTISIL